MVPKTKRSKPIGAFIVDYHNPNIPMEPPPEVNVMLLDSAFKEILAKKFEERPCWTRQALELRIAPNDIKKLKQYVSNNERFCKMRSETMKSSFQTSDAV
jgi:hypothetical protein